MNRAWEGENGVAGSICDNSLYRTRIESVRVAESVIAQSGCSSECSSLRNFVLDASLQVDLNLSVDIVFASSLPLHCQVNLLLHAAVCISSLEN